MNSVIAVSIDAGGCSLASVNPVGIPTLIPNFVGSFVTPLEFGIGTERIEVGHSARCYLEDDPSIHWAENLISLFGKDVSFQSEGRVYKANDLLDCLVGELQKSVEQSWLGTFNSPIVAVSANLNHLQRQMLTHAFRSAGADTVRLVDSAIAASFYVQPAPCKKPILICDLQTDCVQASLVQVDQTERSILAVRQSRIAEDDRLNHMLAEGLKSSIQPQLFANVEPEVFNRAVQCTAKTMLDSIMKSKQDVLPCRKILVGSTVELAITAEKIGKMGEHYFEKASDCLSKCLNDAGISWNDIEAVCFIGELSNLTVFVESYACFASIPIAVRRIPNARWASAYGAALMGQQIGNGSCVKTAARSLNQLALRVRSGEHGMFTRLPLISHGTILPAKLHHTFKTSRIDQERLILEIVEGTGSDFQVVKLAQFGPLFPQSERHPIEVRFRWDEQGFLKATAFDGITKQPIHSCLVSSSVEASPS